MSPSRPGAHDPAPVTPGSADPTGATTTRLAALVREHLDPVAGTEALGPVLARLGGVLGFEAVAVLRSADRHLVPVATAGFDADHVPDRLPRDAGIASAALASGAPVICPDAAADRRWFDASGGTHSAGIALPMSLGAKPWGVMVLESKDGAPLGALDVEALRPLADELAWAFEAARLHGEAREQARDEEYLRRGLEATSAVISAGLQEPDLGAALDRMVREVRDRLEWESLAVLLRNGDALEVAAYYGYAEEVRRTRFSTSRGILGHVIVTGRPYLAADTRDDPFYQDIVAQTRSEICAPLRIAGTVRGVINAESVTPGRFTSADLDLMQRLADQMSLVLHNLELLDAEKETVARLHELDRFKSRLLTLASHELRTPLTVVLGFAEVLAEHGPNLPAERRAEYARSIVRHASSLGRLVDHMLIASEIEQGELSIVYATIELEPLVAEVISGVSGEIQVRPGLANATVRADPYRLKQVLSALLDNAVKYAGDGVIELDARIDGAATTLLLRDEGPGIAAEERERVFELFRQVGEHGIAGRRGVGLGLTIARDLVRLMGGDLQLTSAEGYGVTFLLSLQTA